MSLSNPLTKALMDRAAKATHQETRAHNERLVLATIYQDGPVSRAGVARLTGLTRTTVSDVVSGLLADGMTREVGRGPSTGGKAPILLEVEPDARHLVGIDLGERAFRGAIVNLRGRLISSLEVPADEPDGEGALERVFRLIDGLLATTDRRIVGIGIGAPGLADTTLGTVLRAVNLEWRDFPLGQLVRERYGIPVYVANDSQATALAEYVFGGPQTSNLIVVRVGRGIGAGMILNGQLFQGDGFGAGEIGHTSVVDAGEPCRCGSFGCLETVASSRAIVEKAIGRLPAGNSVLPIDEVAAAFRRGDERTRRVVLEGARYLGLALAALVGALNVNRIVLVGSVTQFGAPWLEVVRDTMRSRALPLLASATDVEIGGLGEDAVVLGASALLLMHELGFPLPPGLAGSARQDGASGRAAPALPDRTLAATVPPQAEGVA